MSNKALGKIAAVVVTYNRKNLLGECLLALVKQTYILERIIIIDNASTDGTTEFLSQKGYLDSSQIEYVRLSQNTGGAGGFYEGLKRGFQSGFDWIWAMDDDTLATPTALEKMISNVEYLSAKFCDSRIGFICSNVLWAPGIPHFMNIPSIRPIIHETPFNKFCTESNSVLLVETCSFVSVLINRQAIAQIGLPVKELFIWGDDVEYTSRISDNRFWGLMSLNSVVYHKTKENYSADLITDKPENAWRYFYDTRNKVYRYRISHGKYISFVARNLLRDIRKIISKRKDSKLLFLKYIIKGYLKSLIFNPKPEKI